MISYYLSPFGSIQIEEKDDCIISLGFRTQELEPPKKPDKSPLLQELEKQLALYFQGKLQYFDIPYKAQGTEFQEKVWHALTTIPYGETRSYKDIAIAVENPKGARAVGMANNKNPIGILIPCHRVIGAKGDLVGYASGIDIKQRLLALEKLSR